MDAWEFEIRVLVFVNDAISVYVSTVCKLKVKLECKKSTNLNGKEMAAVLLSFGFCLNLCNASRHASIPKYFPMKTSTSNSIFR